MTIEQLITHIEKSYPECKTEINKLFNFTIIKMTLSDDYQFTFTYNASIDKVKIMLKDKMEIIVLKECNEDLFHHVLFTIALESHVPSELLLNLTS